MFSEKVIEHFTNPQNVYEMKDADSQGQIGDVNCGDALTMFIKVEDDVIKEISYLVYGCCAAIATSSMTSVLAKEKSLEEALKITEDDIVQALDGLPESKVHCSLLGVNALRKAIYNYLKKENRLKGEMMKVAIPVDTQTLETSICPSFGRTPFFMIYDLEDGIGEFIINTAADSPGGAGIKAAQLIVDSKVDAVLTFRCGENAATVLSTAGIKMYKAIGGSVQDNLDAMKAEKLAQLTEFHAGFHGHQG